MNHLAAALIRAGGGSMAASLLILPARARPPATKAAVAVEHFLTPRYRGGYDLATLDALAAAFPALSFSDFFEGLCRFMAADIMIYGVREEGELT
jgi:hypothetical protein